MKILAIGLGYCARHLIRSRGLAGESLGTTRDRTQLETMVREGFRPAFCDGPDCDAPVRAALVRSQILLVSAPPEGGSDPILAAYGAELAASRELERVIYLSSIGVYGDHGGAWIDEDSEMRPTNERSRQRLKAEADWRRFAQETGKPVFLLRLAGIYGPGRNQLAQLASGSARRVAKPGQMFNRIHVEDVARALEAAISSPAPGGAWNIADDEPTPPSDPIVYAAALLGVEPPPEIPYEQAQMTPMARSFWLESRRVRNSRMKQDLGVSLAYPTYRDGLRTLFAAGEGRAKAPM